MIRLNAIKFGVAGGLITVISVFVTGLSVLIVPGYVPILTNFFTQIYAMFGLQTGVFALILSSILTFIDGFILTWLFAIIYNKLL